MIVKYTDLYDEVLPDVPGVLPALALNAIRNACIEFCDKTHIHVVDLDPIDAVAATGTYSLDGWPQTVVCAVKSARYQGLTIESTSPSRLDEKYVDWPTVQGTPGYFTQENESELILVPMPSASLAEAITAKVALKPSRVSVGIEQWIVEKHLEQLVHGAKARLFAIQKKPWSNPELAAYHGKEFKDAIDAARIAVARGRNGGKLRTVARFF